jgi:hypothetical protein
MLGDHRGTITTDSVHSTSEEEALSNRVETPIMMCQNMSDDANCSMDALNSVFPSIEPAQPFDS